MNPNDIVKFVSDGVDQAKSGKAMEIYGKVAPLHDNGSLPVTSHYAFGWIIYYALHQSDERAIKERKRMLARFLRLNVTRPHKQHSMILTEAIRLYRNSRERFADKPGVPRDPDTEFSIVRFTLLWDTAYLRPGDWRRKNIDSKTLSSTAEHLITLLADELERTGATEGREQLKRLLERALEEFPDSATLWAQRSSLHKLDGERDEARQCLRKALLLAPGKSYLWTRLAALVPSKENMRLHIALLYKALRAPGPDQFKGRIRLSLARALAEAGVPGAASSELSHVRKLYTDNNWHLPAECEAIEKLIPRDTVREDPSRLYAKVAHLADQAIFSLITPITVKKTYHKDAENEGKFGRPLRISWRVTDQQGNHFWLEPERFSLPVDLPTGTTLKIRVFGGRVVDVQFESEQF